MDVALIGRRASENEQEQLESIGSDATCIVFSSPEYYGNYYRVAKWVIYNKGFPLCLPGNRWSC